MLPCCLSPGILRTDYVNSADDSEFSYCNTDFIDNLIFELFMDIESFQHCPI